MPLPLILVEIVLVAAGGFFALYLALLSLLALSARGEQSGGDAWLYRRIAVLIPAHDEEATIGRTLLSLSQVSYPRLYYGVFVVADNCKDQTAALARSYGAEVFERTNLVQRGKGHALRWAFEKLLARSPGFDAVCVIDADTIASRNLLRVLNRHLERGEKVVQVSDLVQEQEGAWSSEITRLGFTLYNYVRPRARNLFGGAVGLRGNGMCFSTKVLRAIPWQAYSINEDLEYGLVLTLNRIRIHFAPEASVYATMPRDPSNAESQRARWETGRYAIIRRFAPALVSAAFRDRTLRPIDALIDLLTPPLANLTVFLAVMVFLNAVLAALRVAPAREMLLVWLLVLVAAAVHVVAGMHAAGADKSLYRALLHVPRYLFWKIRLYAKLFLRKGGRSREWIRTARERGKEGGMLKDSVL